MNGSRSAEARPCDWPRAMSEDPEQSSTDDRFAGGFVVRGISMGLSGRRCQRRSGELRFDREIDQVANAHRRTRSRHAIGDAKI